MPRAPGLQVACESPAGGYGWLWLRILQMARDAILRLRNGGLFRKAQSTNPDPAKLPLA